MLTRFKSYMTIAHQDGTLSSPTKTTGDDADLEPDGDVKSYHKATVHTYVTRLA